MYKLLLCVRYLQTRYLAFICIVSVMLGVATLIVVNSVMSGFSTKLKDRLHGVLSDVVIDTDNLAGFHDPDQPDADGRPTPIPVSVMEERIRQSPAWERIEAMTPTIEVIGILQFHFRGQVMTKPVKLIGVRPAGRAAVGGFSEYLVRQKGEAAPSFELTPEALQHLDWNRKRRERENPLVVPGVPPVRLAGSIPGVGPGESGLVPEVPQVRPAVPDPNALPAPDMQPDVGLPPPRLHGAIPGYMIAHMRFRNDDGKVIEEAALRPGDDVTITTVGGDNLKPVWGTFLVADYVKTEMSEYDQGLVYVSLEQLQKIRGMGDQCTAIQIKLKDYERDKAFVIEELQALFPERKGIRVGTWEDRQGPLLAAIDVERGILNLLLFMIVGVAGFSILAIFTMIVSEKFRDIGIMKSLGASSRGVMSIFLGYGLLLGTVGCGLGTAMGLWITSNINAIEAFLSRATGTQVFPRDVYYFKEIPTNVDPGSVALVNLGAVLIAVVFSLLPAYRAARLHPVRALRFE